MLRIAQISLLTAAFALALPALAHAQASPRDVMRDFGILGTWATDCSKPSSEDNFYTVYAGLPNGNGRRTYYNTPAREKAYSEVTITRATRLPADQLSYRQEGLERRRVGDHDVVEDEKIDVILRKDGNKYQIWSSVRGSGEVLVKNGKFPKDGGESPWQTKCYD